MKNRIIFIGILIGLITSGKVLAQNELKPIDYKIIAEGIDSPIPELQIACFNKFFNKDYLSAEFRKKYNLDDKTLYKKKMLIEIFRTDKDKKGIDKIELIEISENDTEIVIRYNVVNSISENDNKQLSPFLIVQIPKSKKNIKFIANGIESGKGKEIYVD